MDKRKRYWLVVFCDAGGKWRWHLRSSNSKLIATSGESFANSSNAWRAAARMQDLLSTGVDCMLEKHAAAGRKAANAKTGRTGRTVAP